MIKFMDDMKVAVKVLITIKLNAKAKLKGNINDEVIVNA